MKLRDYARSLVEDFKASRRGEKRIAPRAARGRIYAPKDGASSPNAPFTSVTKQEAVLTMKITRANGTVERITVPAQVTRNG